MIGNETSFWSVMIHIEIFVVVKEHYMLIKVEKTAEKWCFNPFSAETVAVFIDIRRLQFEIRLCSTFEPFDYEF